MLDNFQKVIAIVRDAFLILTLIMACAMGGLLLQSIGSAANAYCQASPAGC